MQGRAYARPFFLEPGSGEAENIEYSEYAGTVILNTVVVEPQLCLGICPAVTLWSCSLHSLRNFELRGISPEFEEDEYMRSRFFPPNEPAMPRRQRKVNRLSLMDYIAEFFYRRFRVLQALFYGTFLS